MSLNKSKRPFHKTAGRARASAEDRPAAPVIVSGKHTVMALLTQGPQRLEKLVLAQEAAPQLAALAEAAQRAGVPVVHQPKALLDDLQPEVAHQGVLAWLRPDTIETPWASFEAILARCLQQATPPPWPLLLMLDGVTDPRNLGAVLRVADGAGARGVIVAKRRAVGGAGWSAVAKTSSGALASMPLVSVANLTQCLKTLKKMGFWVVGAGFGATAKPYHTLDYRQPTVLVLGSEGEGLSRLVSEQCDWLATLPMRGMVASLNVATAAAVLAYEATRQQFLPAGGTTTAGAAP